MDRRALARCIRTPGATEKTAIASNAMGNVHVQEGLMARRHWVCAFAFVLALVAQPVAPRAQQSPEASTAIAVRTATADGVSVQYLSAGSGPAIVLLHGYAETSRMWRPLIPRLAATHTVIAPDLPGIG